METSCGYLDDKVMWISTDEKRMISHLLKLYKTHPADMKVVCMPEENDGCMYARCPASWLKIQPPIQRNFTPEQRQAASERMRAIRRSQ